MAGGEQSSSSTKAEGTSDTHPKESLDEIIYRCVCSEKAQGCPCPDYHVPLLFLFLMALIFQLLLERILVFVPNILLLIMFVMSLSPMLRAFSTSLSYVSIPCRVSQVVSNRTWDFVELP